MFFFGGGGAQLFKNLYQDLTVSNGMYIEDNTLFLASSASSQHKEFPSYIQCIELQGHDKDFFNFMNILSLSTCTSHYFKLFPWISDHI